MGVIWCDLCRATSRCATIRKSALQYLDFPSLDLADLSAKITPNNTKNLLGKLNPAKNRRVFCNHGRFISRRYCERLATSPHEPSLNLISSCCESTSVLYFNRAVRQANTGFPFNHHPNVSLITHQWSLNQSRPAQTDSRVAICVCSFGRWLTWNFTDIIT